MPALRSPLRSLRAALLPSLFLVSISLTSTLFAAPSAEPSEAAPSREPATTTATAATPTSPAPTPQSSPAAPAEPTAPTGRVAEGLPSPGSGLRLDLLDRSVRPQDDLYRFANGAWLDRFEMPADKSRYGVFTQLHERVQVQLRAIIDELSGADAESLSEDGQKLQRALAAFMDTEAIERRGLSALQPTLDEISAADSADALSHLLTGLQLIGVSSPLGHWIDQDMREPTRYALYLNQGGLGLPDKSYYSSEGERFEKIRAAYKLYLKGLFEVMGSTAEEGAEAADAVYALEARIAAVQWDRAATRDRERSYNPRTLEALQREAAGINWARFFGGLGLPGAPVTIVRQPDYASKLAEIFGETRTEGAAGAAARRVWQSYLKARVLDSYAAWLPARVFDLHFAFHGRAVSGQEEPEPRWRRAMSAINSLLGEALGALYVARHFRPEAKARMEGLVEQLIGAFRERLLSRPWLSDETKRAALAKLERFTVKIGYPRRWRSYSALDIAADDAAGNWLRGQRFEATRHLDKLGRPIDREEWFMPPQMVNAYYNPPMNEIVFPAAILQPPFFNLEADDAINYGGIGGVIGHELSHGFDDQGARSDGDGVLRNWWTESDLSAFQARGAALVTQYEAFEPLPEQHVNGSLTLGENIGDLGGLTIAWFAWRRSLAGGASPVLDGFTGAQRFFLGWAQVWACKYRDNELQRRLATDPHSPAVYRVLGVVPNHPGFYEAFSLQASDRLYRAPEERVEIW